MGWSSKKWGHRIHSKAFKRGGDTFIYAKSGRKSVYYNNFSATDLIIDLASSFLFISGA